MKTLITKELDLFLSDLKDQFDTTSVTVLIDTARSPYKRRVRQHPMSPNPVGRGNFVYYQPIVVQLVNTNEYEENLLKQKARELLREERRAAIAMLALEEPLIDEEDEELFVASHSQSRRFSPIIENYAELLNEDARKIQTSDEDAPHEEDGDDSWYTMRRTQICTIFLHLPYAHKKHEVLADFRIEEENYKNIINLRVSVLKEKQSREFVINKIMEVNEEKMRLKVDKSSEEYVQKLRIAEYFMNVFQNLKKEGI